MTIIIGQLVLGHYILASDGRVTDSSGTIHNEDCNKIETFYNYVIAGAGDCSSAADLKRFLIHASDSDLPLDCVKPDVIESDSDGSSIVVELDQVDDCVTNVYQIDVESGSIKIRNLLAENERLTLLGCGSSVYRGAVESNFEVETIDSAIKTIERGIYVTSKLNSACNNNVTLKTFKLARGIV